MAAVTFEDVAVNFTLEEWALLNPFQKKLYRDVMGETFNNIAAIGEILDNQKIEEEYNNYLKSLRNEEVQKCYQYKVWNQYKEIFLSTSDANEDGKQESFTQSELLPYRNPQLGYLSLNMPTRAPIALKESITFEDVAVNFTLEEWTLLNPCQKKLYRDVMRETFRDISAIGRHLDNEEIEEYNIYWRNLRSEVEKCYQCEAWSHCKEKFLCVSDTNVYIKQFDLKPIESLACRKAMIGHLSLNVPIRAHTTLKPDECFGSKEKLYKCENGRNW